MDAIIEREAVSADLVLIPKFSELTGHSRKAVERKIAVGTWLEGVHFFRRGGRIYLSMQAFYTWVRTGK